MLLSFVQFKQGNRVGRGGGGLALWEILTFPLLLVNASCFSTGPLSADFKGVKVLLLHLVAFCKG